MHEKVGSRDGGNAPLRRAARADTAPTGGTPLRRSARADTAPTSPSPLRITTRGDTATTGAICKEVRNELQRFAEDVLQPQLSQFAERLHQDLRSELDSCQGLHEPGRRLGEPSRPPGEPAKPREGRQTLPARIPSKLVLPPAGQPPDLQAVAEATEQKPKPGLLRGSTVATLGTEFDDEKDKKPNRPSQRRSSISTSKTMLFDDEPAWNRASSRASAQADVKTPKTDYGGICRTVALAIVTSSWFERGVALVILSNAVYIGIVTEIMAVNELSVAPLAFQVIELIFLGIFTTEIGLKLFVYRCSLFRSRTPDGNRNDQVYWNFLDCTIIGLQVIEVALIPFNADGTAFKGLTVIRILRLLRLVRIVRLVKVMRFVADLRMIVYSIWRSISLFFWSVVALVLLNFICSVYFTEFVLTRKVNGDLSNPAELDRYFGSLIVTMVSLFQAVTGGMDWGALTDVLVLETHSWVLLPFILYVAFNQIAMLNVISGVFLETAMEIAREEKEIYVIRNARLVFTAADHNSTGTVTWADFERALDHPHMQSFFDAVDIRPSEARTLFDLLDTTGDGSISSDEFLNGCLRVKGPAKALDLLILSREVSHLFEKHVEAQKMLQNNRKVIRSNRKAILENRQAIQAVQLPPLSGEEAEAAEEAGSGDEAASGPGRRGERRADSGSRLSRPMGWSSDTEPSWNKTSQSDLVLLYGFRQRSSPGAADNDDDERSISSLPGQCRT